MFSTGLRYLGAAQTCRETLLELSVSTCPMQKHNPAAVLAISVVEFSHGLAAPFMELSVGKHERNRKKSDDEPKRNGERSECKKRARKRALQKAA